MVVEVSLLKTYHQFLQQKEGNTQSASEKTAYIQDSFIKQQANIPDKKLYTDIKNVKDTFEKFRDNTIQIKAQVDDLDNKAVKNNEVTKAVFAALSPVIPFRRVYSVPEKVEEKDYFGTAGTLAIAGMLLPEDLRDTRDAARQILHKILPKSVQEYIQGKSPTFYANLINHSSKYDYKEFQTPFSFIRGSFLEPLVNKMVNKYGYYLHEWDKPLINTKFGQKIQDLLKVEDAGIELTGRSVPQIVKNDDTGKYFKQDRKVYAYKLEGSLFGKLICRALQRTTLYGAIALFAICIPSIVRAFNKPENTQDKMVNGGKQTVKSAISVISTLAGIGLGGALLVPFGPVGSVVGMGIGSVIGAYISSKISRNIKTI
ncbi:MAG: hypothetical protein PHC34_06700 [Candidatus Gastranaerophilales bacterium]|nr:hypothetical protein [Candidatus Gastranaerophilales bacterium]